MDSARDAENPFPRKGSARARRYTRTRGPRGFPGAPSNHDVLQIITITLYGLALLAGVLSPVWALALVAAMYPLEQALQASVTYFITHVSMVNITVGVVALISFLNLARNAENLRGFMTPMFIVCTVLHLWSIISIAWTPSRDAAIEFVRTGIPYFGLFVVVAPLFVRDAASLGAFVRTFLYLGTAVVGLVVINPNFTFYSGRLGFVIEGNVRSNPLAIGELGGTLIIVATLLRQGPVQWLVNLARVFAFLIGALLALQSGSRGQLLFSVFIALLFVPISKRIQNVFGFIGTLLTAAIVVPVVLFLAQRFVYSDVLGRWDAADLSGGFGVRLLNWFDVLQVWGRTPSAWAFGLGLNAFSSVTTAGSKEGYPHNIFVETLTECGLPMVLLLLWMIWSTARDCRWLFRRFAEDPANRVSVAVLIALGLYFFLIANKQANLWGQGVMFMYFCIIARLRRRTELADELEPAVFAESDEGEHESHESDEAMAAPAGLGHGGH